MTKMSLRTRLITSYLVAGLTPLIAIGFYSYSKSSSSLEKEAVDKLIAVRNIKGDAVKRYFEGIKNQMLTFSSDVSIRKAMKGFKKGYNSFNEETNVSNIDLIAYKSKLRDYYTNQFGSKYNSENKNAINAASFLDKLSSTGLALQYHYIGNNKNPLGSKETLDFAPDGSTYSKVHAEYHPSIRNYLQKFGYYDIFLVDINSGDVIYSVFKELDYSTSLSKGAYRNTNFADAFRKAKQLSKPGEFILVDYKKYTPSYEAPASFIASPIWEGREKIGIAVFQMPLDRLNAIMSERSGMGKTGETYLVGQDKLMRSDSFLDSKNYNVVSSFKNPNAGSIDSVAVNQALSGESDSKESINYLNTEVISAYTPINILGLKWALVAEISNAEAMAAVFSIRTAIFTITGISCLAILVLAFLMSNGLSKKIASIVSALIDRTKELVDSSDKISVSSGQLSEAANSQASSLQSTVSSIDEISSMVARNADSAKSSTDVSTKSNDAAARGKRTVEAMISSIEHISGSNSEIANEMQKNNEDISKIVSVISEIGEKTKVINDIVFQTKLLSFNASVEAARAGEHGKGFAVVAEEVGNLASMSGKAAFEITEMLDSSIKQVKDIVDSTKTKVESLVSTSKDKVDVGTKTAHECGDALDEILQNVSCVNEMVTEIASASAEQSTGVNEVTKSIQELDQTTHQNSAVAKESARIAETLKSQANGLNDVADELLGVINGSSSRGHSVVKTREALEVSPKEKNVVSLSEHRQAPEKEEVSVKKASGSDIGIPNKLDSRFEEL